MLWRQVAFPWNLNHKANPHHQLQRNSMMLGTRGSRGVVSWSAPDWQYGAENININRAAFPKLQVANPQRSCAGEEVSDSVIDRDLKEENFPYFYNKEKPSSLIIWSLSSFLENERVLLSPYGGTWIECFLSDGQSYWKKSGVIQMPWAGILYFPKYNSATNVNNKPSYACFLYSVFY